MAYRKPDPALPKVGARLALTRQALDLTRFQMAQHRHAHLGHLRRRPGAHPAR